MASVKQYNAYIARSTETVPANGIEPPLSQAVGYIIVLVVGLAIAFGMVFITKLLQRAVGEDNRKTEMFMTANRSVRPGLTTSAVVSSWLWSTAILGASLVGYNYGVSGPFWYAAGCTPMITFFALLGISCKRKIPEAHTLLEIVRIRYGKVAHVVYMFLCLVNNLIAVANMLLGASAVITAMTGVHIIAVTFLLPVGVALYTFVGGIKATFLTDYMHTFTILVLLCYFTAKAFSVDAIGSIGHLYDLLQAASEQHPVSGNQDGSYLTMTSKGAMLFGIIHILTNFGLVIMDTGFFIKAFSASPSAVVPGYVIGGIVYFPIPWAIGTLASSICLGLETTSSIFPTFPRRLSTTEIGSGLILPYALITVAGKTGAVIIALVTFMAVTSTLSAQVIAVSSIISFDIYRTYIYPQATDRDVIRWSHYGVVFFALVSAAFSTLLHYVGIDLSWTLYMLGVLTCPGIFPTTFAILWRKQSKAAAIISPILGMATGIAVWIGSAYGLYGEVTVVATGEILPCVYGTTASALSPIVYSVALSMFKPDEYDWSSFKKEKLAFEEQHSSTSMAQSVNAERADPSNSFEQTQTLKRWSRIAAYWAIATFLGHWVLWPMPMYASRYVFQKGFYVAWMVISLIWIWITLFVVGFYPIIDGRAQILAVWHSVFRERSGVGFREASTPIVEVEGQSDVGVMSDGKDVKD
ncbi:urea active transporter [Xylariaceae sp. FL0662B]|nr:urea active transporter [Xylariaceae sp. FL0662B]